MSMKDSVSPEIASRKRQAALIPGTTITFTTTDDSRISPDAKPARNNSRNLAPKLRKISGNSSQICREKQRSINSIVLSFYPVVIVANVSRITKKTRQGAVTLKINY